LKKALYSSLFIHALVFLFISITLPEIKTKEIEYISVEIINEKIDKKENTNEAKVVKNTEEIIIEKPIDKIEYKPQPPKKKPIKKITKPEITKLNIKPQPPQKKPEFKPKQKNIEKKVSKTEDNNDDIFENMLKNLAENEEKAAKPEIKVKEKNKIKTTRSSEETKKVQKNIANIIYRQIKTNYTLPPAPDLKVLNDITVQLRIYVGPDGTINKTIVNKNSLNRAKEDTTYLPYVEAAQRAIKKLGKFSKLPEKEYKLWKIIDISFTPYQT
jgi:outer membrane biosynthesis protein TonB